MCFVPFEPKVNFAFFIGSIGITWYGMFAVIGFAVSFLYVYVQWIKKNYSKWDFNNLFFISVIASLWGARLWYIIFNPIQAFENVDGVLSFLNALIGVGAGRSIMGSIFFMTLIAVMYPRMFHRHQLNWKVTFDIMLPAMLLGQAIGRWGNFTNHQVFGEIINVANINFLPKFIVDGMYIKTANGVVGYRNPLFLYESFADVIAFVIIISGIKLNKYFKDGTQGSTFLIFYGIIRAIMEITRDSQYQMRWGTFLTSYWFALIFLMFGILLFCQCQTQALTKAWGIIKWKRNA